MSDNRIERFKEGVAELDVSAAGGARDKPLVALGLVMMLAGPVIGFLCYFSSVNADFAEDQNELIILTLAGMGISLVGLGIFLRYSLGRFLRFFLMRQLYEGQANRDELAAAMRERS